MTPESGKFIVDYHGYTPAQIFQFFRSFPKAIKRKDTHKTLSFQAGTAQLEIVYKKVTQGLWYMKFEHLFEEDTIVNFEGHQNDYYELEYFFAGGNSAVQRDAGGQFSLHNKAVFIPGNQKRSWAIDHGTKLRTYKLIFSHAFLLEQLHHHSSIPSNSFLDRVVRRTQAYSARAILNDELNLIHELDKGPAPELLHDIWIKGIALQLLYKFFQIQSEPKAEQADAFEELNEALKLMQECVDGSFPGIHKLADASYLSTSCFKRKFKDRYGITPEAYFRRLQMDKAEVMLSGQGLTVREVAHYLGYISQKNFSKAFCRLKGYLPSRVKKDFSRT